MHTDKAAGEYPGLNPGQHRHKLCSRCLTEWTRKRWPMDGVDPVVRTVEFVTDNWEDGPDTRRVYWCHSCTCWFTPQEEL